MKKRTRLTLRYRLYLKVRDNILLVGIADMILNLWLGILLQKTTGINWYEGMTIMTSGIKLPFWFASFMAIEFFSAVFWSAVDDKYSNMPL